MDGKNSLELTSIQRLLRPIKAKLTSLSKILELPSTVSLEREGRCTRTFQKTYQRFQKFNVAEKSNQYLNSSNACNNLKAASDSALAPTLQLPSPIRKHNIYLKMFFKDVLKKHWKPFKVPALSSLAQLAAFEIGRQIPTFTEVDDQEWLYASTPPHFRRYAACASVESSCCRFVLVHHLCAMFTSSITLPSIMNELIEACYDYAAYHQVMRRLIIKFFSRHFF